MYHKIECFILKKNNLLFLKLFNPIVTLMITQFKKALFESVFSI